MFTSCLRFSNNKIFIFLVSCLFCLALILVEVYAQIWVSWFTSTINKFKIQRKSQCKAGDQIYHYVCHVQKFYVLYPVFHRLLSSSKKYISHVNSIRTREWSYPLTYKISLKYHIPNQKLQGFKQYMLEIILK